MARRTHVFISYSKSDLKHLKRLQIHLKPLIRLSQADIWDDTKIKPGGDWRKEIKEAIDRAFAAILLVSADFLASDFISENELPPLLEAAEKDRMRVMPVILSPSLFAEIPSLSKFQAFNDPEKPLIALDDFEKEALWEKVAKGIKELIPSGAHLPPVEDKEPVDSPRRKLQREFEITNKRFYPDRSPQVIFIQLTNRGTKPITVNKVKYSDTLEFPASFLSSSYKRDGHYYLIRDDMIEVPSGENLAIEIELQGVYDRADIDRVAGRWGYLRVDVTHSGTQVELFYSI